MTTLSWFLAFAGFAALIVLHELGHFAAAKAVGMRVERFALFFPPLIVKKKIGETEYGIGAIPLGGYVRISGMNPSEELPDEVRTRAYHAQPVWKRIVVIAAGPLVNIVLAFVLLLCFFWLIGPRDGITNVVDDVQPGLPAYGVIDIGDRVVAVDGWSVHDWGGSPEGLSMAIASHTCPGEVKSPACKASAPAQITVQKPDGARETVTLRPVYDSDAERMRAGFSYDPGEKRTTLPFGEAVSVTADRLWWLTLKSVQLPFYVFDPVQRQQISGVVGSYERTRQTIVNEPPDTIAILAIISMALAVINLFPFLPLDGGHIFWAIVEKVRSRPVSMATMERAGVVGIMLLIPLFVIGLTNDLGRIFGPGFGPPQ
jgi:regulator of sigma E protease